MSEDPQMLLSAFVAWASAQQQRLLHNASPYVAKLQVGKATSNRAVTFTVERFKVEPTGWIGDELQEGGYLTVWQNGCADAEWETPHDLNAEMPLPSYQEHWDDLDPQSIGSALSSFTARFEGS